MGERGVRIFQIGDGHDYLIAGFANSNDGDVSPHAYPERLHYWFIKIDSLGNILWDRVVGGNGGEWLLNATSTMDGGVVGTGYTASWEGDITTYYGWYDAWLIKLNADGSTGWDFTIGTENQDFGESIIQTSDGGFLAGTSSIIEGQGNISCVPHSSDGEGVLFKLDSNGNERWHRCYGGSGDENIWDLLEVEDGYVFSAIANAGDGDLEGSGWHGEADIWIVKVDFSGNIIWQKCYGGSEHEVAFRILQTSDGSFMVFGRTQSHDGDVSYNPHNIYNPSIWVFKISSTGELLWEQCFSTGVKDYLEFGVVQKSDFQYVIAGSQLSNSFDYWIFEVTDTTMVGINELPSAKRIDITVKPNPASQWAAFDYVLPESETMATITITDLAGKTVEVLQVNGQQGQKLWDTHLIESGMYFYTLQVAGSSKTGKIVVSK